MCLTFDKSVYNYIRSCSSHLCLDNSVSSALQIEHWGFTSDVTGLPLRVPYIYTVSNITFWSDVQETDTLLTCRYSEIRIRLRNECESTLKQASSAWFKHSSTILNYFSRPPLWIMHTLRYSVKPRQYCNLLLQIKLMSSWRERWATPPSVMQPRLSPSRSLLAAWRKTAYMRGRQARKRRWVSDTLVSTAAT